MYNITIAQQLIGLCEEVCNAIETFCLIPKNILGHNNTRNRFLRGSLGS